MLAIKHNLDRKMREKSEDRKAHSSPRLHKKTMSDVTKFTISTKHKNFATNEYQTNKMFSHVSSGGIINEGQDQ